MNTFHNTLESLQIIKSICIIKGDESKGNLQYPLVPCQNLGWKGGTEGGWEVLHTLTSSPRGAFWSSEQGGVFKTGIRRKWTFVPQRVTLNIDGIRLGVPTHTHTHTLALAWEAPWKHRVQFSWTRKNTKTVHHFSFSFNQFFQPSHLPLLSFLSPSIHFSIHPLQSLQSAVSYRIPLQSSDAALQRM